MTEEPPSDNVEEPEAIPEPPVEEPPEDSTIENIRKYLAELELRLMQAKQFKETQLKEQDRISESITNLQMQQALNIKQIDIKSGQIAELEIQVTKLRHIPGLLSKK